MTLSFVCAAEFSKLRKPRRTEVHHHRKLATLCSSFQVCWLHRFHCATSHFAGLTLPQCHYAAWCKFDPDAEHLLLKSSGSARMESIWIPCRTEAQAPHVYMTFHLSPNEDQKNSTTCVRVADHSKLSQIMYWPNPK